jgi:L-seryl-tRNA(Ser) seleniumtransferase
MTIRGPMPDPDIAALRQLPGIDALLSHPALAGVIRAHGAEPVKARLRSLQLGWRQARQAPGWSADPAAYADVIAADLDAEGYRRVFNLTGTLLHTNLGRAPLPDAAFDAVRKLVTGPMNLEFDLATGSRGDRERPVEARLRRLTGAPAATIVNNCAAALMLVLNTFALGRPVPVSRGELIEIGGSFRLPELMTRAGCRLVEVGTTNRTRTDDFRAAVTAETALLLKVHPSNYRIEGFTATPGVRDLAALATEVGLPLCVDLGSGALLDFQRWGLPKEPTPGELLAQGADLVLFSGDKLLGGVQAGMIVGRTDLVAACRQNPMKRALRADKVTLTLLDQVLGLYEHSETLDAQLPMLQWLNLTEAQLRARGSAVIEILRARLPAACQIDLDVCAAEMGSGSLPEASLPSLAVVIGHPQDRLLRALQVALRRLPTPVIGRLQQGRILLDLRGADPLPALLETLGALEAPA